MRRLVVALIAVVLTGTMLTFTAPADASGLTWHTMMKNRKALFQACKQPGAFDTRRNQTEYTVYWRVNNQHGRKRAFFKETAYDGPQWVQQGEIYWVAKHSKKGPLSNSPLYDSEVVQMWSRYGAHRKTGSVTIAMIGLC